MEKELYGLSRNCYGRTRVSISAGNHINKRDRQKYSGERRETAGIEVKRGADGFAEDAVPMVQECDGRGSVADGG
jgi:hypothetical protein